MDPSLKQWLSKLKEAAPENERALLEYAHGLFMLGQPDKARNTHVVSQQSYGQTSHLSYQQALFQRYQNQPAPSWREGFFHGFQAQKRYPDVSQLPNRWHGEDLEGKTIAVIGDQGIGDQLRWCHHFHSLATAADRITAWVHPKLISLLSLNFPSIRFLNILSFSPQTTDFSVFDYTSALGDIDGYHIAGETPVFLPPNYLKPDTQLQKKWGKWLNQQAANKPKIGICTHSTQTGCERDIHYAHFTDMKALLQTNGAHFFSLQVSLQKNKNEQSLGGQASIIDGLDIYNDIDNLAAFINGLDLVIAPSTMVADLAAAVGTQVWRFQTGPNFDIGGVNPWYGPLTQMCYRTNTESWAALFNTITTQLKTHLMS